jgi:hypothetical protein
MVRRKSRTTKRTTRRKQGVSIIGVAETFALLNVATQTMFNTTPVGFLTSVNAQGNTGGTVYGYGYGQHVITLRELIENPFKPQSMGTKGQLALVGDNLKQNGLMGAVQMALIPVAFRLGKNLARPAISRTNRLLNKSGIGSTVKL